MAVVANGDARRSSQQVHLWVNRYDWQWSALGI